MCMYDMCHLVLIYMFMSDLVPEKIWIELKKPNWYSIYQFTFWFTLQTLDHGVYVVIDLRGDVIDVIQKVQRHVDLMQITAVRERLIRSMCNNVVDMKGNC